MGLIEAEDVTEFERILRSNRLIRADFSLTATDTTDPKTDEVSGLHGELTVRRKSTGQNRQYLISNSTSWLDLFRKDLMRGAFFSDDCVSVSAP
ncbi:transcriptional regulator [Pseudoduganella sp. S-14]|jgi:hypothetical protein|uniref:transcriptional regulator n=1 Tax=Pseudoduganella sp. S-14 TaxID=3404065 RepID=UPI003CF52188